MIYTRAVYYRTLNETPFVVFYGRIKIYVPSLLYDYAFRVVGETYMYVCVRTYNYVVRALPSRGGPRTETRIQFRGKTPRRFH